MASKQQGNEEMVESNGSSTYYFRRCKRKRLTYMESLPDDMVFEILLHLPAPDIYDATRLVCRKWYHMIHTHNFICAHLQHAPYGLLFQSIPKDTIFMALRQGRIETSKFSYKMRSPAWVSCNGLIMEFEIKNSCAIYVANPATKQIFVLPPFFHRIHRRNLLGIAYASASMEYKVVVTYFSRKEYHCAILTVGFDNSWRNLPTEHSSLTAKTALQNAPLITEGFIHWAYCGTQVLTSNVETEIITVTPAPVPLDYGGPNRKYLLTGRYLSLLIPCGKFSWDVRETKPETGEWRNLPSIALEAQKCTFEQLGCKLDEILVPVGWLKYLEVLIFSIYCQGPVFFYHNLLTKEIGRVELPTFSKFYSLIVHRNSLAWLGGC